MKNIFKKIVPLVVLFTVASCDLSLSSGDSLPESLTSNTSISETTSELSSEDTTSTISEITSVSSTSEDASSYSSTSDVSSDAWPSEPLNDVTTLDFYNMNDFHGSVVYDTYNSETGINRIASYFKDKQTSNPSGTIITSSGDMWQGSADSNITRGRLVTDAMNLIGFEAMAIGNHEFDWGTDIIRQNAAMADFPFLGANILSRADGLIADFASPYTMIERQGVRVGIIGTIGSTLEELISQSMIADVEFVSMKEPVIAAASELETLGAHITILLNHDPWVDSDVLNYVDLVFNGHSHTYQAETVLGTPLIQARSNGKSIGHARLSYNKTTDSVSVLDYGVDDYIINDDYPEDTQMAALYQSYYDSEIKAVKEEVIGYATGPFDYSNVGNLTVELMLEFGESYGAVAAIHNTGGVRASIPGGEVTFGDVYKALPFDNDLIVFELTGYELKDWLDRYIYVAGVDKYSYKFDATGATINNSMTYKIISISYLTEDINDYPHDVFSEENTHTYARDLVAQHWRDTGTLNPWDY